MLITYMYVSSIIFSAVMAVIFRNYLHGRNLTILVPFLILTSIQEIVLTINGRLDFMPSTSVVYNVYRPITAIVFSFIYYRIPFMSPFKKLINWLTITYLLFVIAVYCIKSITGDFGYLTIVRGFVLTLYSILFLFQYFTIDNLEEERFWQPLMWITAGIAIFYPVVTTSIAFQKYLLAADITLYGQKLYHLIPQVMSIFMYACFSYAFYLCKRINWNLSY